MSLTSFKQRKGMMSVSQLKDIHDRITQTSSFKDQYHLDKANVNVVHNKGNVEEITVSFKYLRVKEDPLKGRITISEKVDRGKKTGDERKKCEGMTKKGENCKNYTLVGSFCHIHR